MNEITFCGRNWSIRDADIAGPGPNGFDRRNVTRISEDQVRLDVTCRDGRWTCAELQTVERVGFGTYQFWLIGRIDLMDPRLVFGFFPYPTPDVGPDGTHEIDIEFSRWGRRETACGHFTVCPTKLPGSSATRVYDVSLQGDFTTHRMTRAPGRVTFSSHHGHRELGDMEGEIASWESTTDVSTAAMPIHMNFWLFQGHPPLNGNNTTLIVANFQVVPD